LKYLFLKDYVRYRNEPNNLHHELMTTMQHLK